MAKGNQRFGSIEKELKKRQLGWYIMEVNFTALILWRLLSLCPISMGLFLYDRYDGNIHLIQHQKGLNVKHITYREKENDFGGNKSPSGSVSCGFTEGMENPKWLERQPRDYKKMV